MAPEEILDSRRKLKVNPQHPKRSPSISHPDQDREFSDASHDQRVQKGTQHKISKMQCQKQVEQARKCFHACRQYKPGDERDRVQKYMHQPPSPSPKDKNNHIAQDGITNMGQLHDQSDIKNKPMENKKIWKIKHHTKAQGGEASKRIRNLRHANPPTPSNPMHQNRRIPYTNAYQRISTNAETRHNAGLQYGQHKCEPSP